jgi:anti-sigma regulatory factor (Ser/Thr protein kinase)
MSTSTTSLTLDSDPLNVAELQSRLSALCRDALIDEITACKVNLVIVEAVNNTIAHGYRFESGHPITVHWRCEDDGIYVQIRDRGPPIPDAVFEAVMPGPDEEHGRGWPMIRENTDTVRCDRDGDENVLKLMWRR